MPSMLLRLAVLALLVPAAFSAAPAPAGPSDNPLAYLSPGYQIHATVHYRVRHKDAAVAARVGANLEALHAAFFKYFRASLTARIPFAPLEAVVVASPAEYEALARNVAKAGSIQTDGFYHPKSKFLMLKNSSPMVAIHEGAHQLLHASGIQSDIGDTWTSEGLAELFAAGFKDGQVNPGPPHLLRLSGYRMAKEKKMLRPLRELVSFGNETNFLQKGYTQDQMSVAYDQFWALVHFLLQGEGGKNREKFFDFLQDSATENQVQIPKPVRVVAKNPAALKKKMDQTQKQMDKAVKAQVSSLDDKRLARFKEYFGEDFAALQKRMDESILAIPIPRGALVQQAVNVGALAKPPPAKAPPAKPPAVKPPAVKSPAIRK